MLKYLIEGLRNPDNKRMVTMGENDGNPENLTIQFSLYDVEQLERAYSLQQMLDNTIFRDRLNTAIEEFTEYLKTVNTALKKDKE